MWYKYVYILKIRLCIMLNFLCIIFKFNLILNKIWKGFFIYIYRVNLKFNKKLKGLDGLVNFLKM